MFIYISKFLSFYLHNTDSISEMVGKLMNSELVTIWKEDVVI